MAAIRESIEIARRPEDVFAYAIDFSRHGEWQESIVSVRVEGDGPAGVGTRAVETRRVGPRTQTTTVEITEHDPPRSFAFRGLDGPVRANGRVTIEPLDDGARTRTTIELEVTGHGLGKLLLPVAQSQVRKEVPAAQQRLKELLEAETG